MVLARWKINIFNINFGYYLFFSYRLSLFMLLPTHSVVQLMNRLDDLPLLCLNSRWVQAECRKLGDTDNPEVSELLKTAVRCLKERPMLFKYCGEEVILSLYQI